MLVRLGAVRLVAQERVRDVLVKRRPDRAPNEAAARFGLRVDVIHDGRSAHATLVGGFRALTGTVRAADESIARTNIALGIDGALM